MKKIITLCTLLAITVAGVVMAMAAYRDTWPQTASEEAATEDGLVFYGSMENNDEWTVDGRNPQFKRGFYSFTLDATAGFTSHGEISNSSTVGNVTDGGFYINGKYYCLVTTGSFLRYTSTFKTVDTETWVTEDTKTFSNSNVIAYDMAYDYTTSTAYAVSPSSYNAYMGGSILNTVNPATGTFTKVADIPSHKIYALACDGNGQLWGIGTPDGMSVPTSLLKINKTSGAVTEVGNLGINLYTATHSSAVFDFRTGKLYWTAKTYVEDEHMQRIFTSGVFEVNTTTGAATMIRVFPNNEVISGIFFKDCHPKAPEHAKALQFVPAAGSLTSGSLKLTLPTLAYDKSTLAGTLDVRILLDGTVVDTRSGLTPGAEYETPQIAIQTGIQHVFTVVCVSNGLESLPATTEVYSGSDTPCPVGNLTVTGSPRGDEAEISWTAPVVGVNGGSVDASTLTYDVVLKPDNETVATGLTDTKFTHRLTRKMGITQYQVIARSGDKASEPASSAVMLLGTAWPLPYLETFDYPAEAYWPMTTIDANHNGSDAIGLKWFFDPNNKCALYYADPNGGTGAADDWLITPVIDLSANHIYRLQFDTRGYMGGTNRVVVTTGALPTAEAQTTVLMDETYATGEGSKTFSVLFRPAEGDCRIGFHNISDGSDHMYIDNIYVTAYGTDGIPAAPTQVTLRKSGGKVHISCVTPTKTVAGQPLASLSALKIYRSSVNNEPIKTFDNPGVGATLEWEDENPSVGVCTYYIVATNAEGDGLEATASIDTNADIPKAVEHLSVTGKNSWQDAVITWSYPVDMTGINGLPLEEGDLYYDVYRVIGFTSTLIAENLQACSYVDTELSSAIPEGRRQSYVTYKVTPKTTGGKGATASSGEVLMGHAYELPYDESWTDQAFDTYPWKMINAATGTSWAVASAGYSPQTGGKGQDGAGLATFSISSDSYAGSADYVSPRIDVSNFSNPQVSFYLYHSTSAETTGSYLKVGIQRETGDVVMLPTTYNVYDSEDGWKQHSFALPAEFRDCDRLSLVFRGTAASRNGCVHIDHVSVTGNRPEYEVKAVTIGGAEKCLIGNANLYDVEVRNIGSLDNGPVRVDFYADGGHIGTETIAEIKAGESEFVNFTYTPSLDNSERPVTLRAEISAANDDSGSNNTIESTIMMVAPMLPYVTDLSGTADGEGVHLAWSDATLYPHQEYVTDNVEAHEAFSITGAGDWKCVDKDGAVTINGISLGGSTVQWPNCGVAQSFIVFNPYQTDGISAVILPRSGQQCFISFAARNGNDDWLISPQLSGERQNINFYAKAAYPYDLEEKFEVWVSKTTTDPADFTRISGDNPVIVSSATEWRNYEYTLEEGVKFFAIRCLSFEQTGLMIDDITYSPAHSALEFWGYNVYRDGTLLTADPIGETSYSDSSVSAHTDYRYNVTAVYKEGESIFSNPASVTVDTHDGIGEVAARGTVTIRPAAYGAEVLNAAGQPIRVYTADGRQLYAVQGTGADRLPLPKGIYVVKAGTVSAKLDIR